MTDINKILAAIPDRMPVRIDLPVTDKSETIRLNCIYLTEQPPQFSLFFSPGTLPLNQLARQQKCSVLIDLSGQSISLTAEIKEIKENNTLQLVACESVNHEQLRNYFRVDVTTAVVAASLVPREFSSEGEDWRLTGETIDVSGSGILAIFKNPIPTDRAVRLELLLPNVKMHLIKTVAHVVRTRKIQENRYQIALHFDEISPEDRDSIVGCCFTIQRKHLRLKVQVRDIL